MKSFLKTLLASFIGAFLAFGLVCLFFFSMLGSLASFADSTTPVVPSSAILQLDFSQTIGEQTVEDMFDISSFSPVPMASTNTIGILTLVKAIDYAATDPNIKMIYMNMDKLESELVYLEELRGALKRFRNSGKPIIAYAMNYSQGGYYLASLADKIYLHPLGTNELIGISSSIMFFKSALSSLGVNIQLIRHGKYKSAGEQFIADEISDANREQNQAMINSLWSTISKSICESRGIDINHFNNAINNLEITTPAEMVSEKIVDDLLTKEQLKDNLCHLMDVETDDDLKAINIDKYAKARLKPNIKAKNKIAIIYADGDIVLGEGEGVSSAKFTNILSKVRKDSTIKAVVFRVNSPGGSAQSAELIRDELLLLKATKPVIASYGKYAASGGYWISANCDKIYTDGTTLTGSIGVFSIFPSFENVMKKIKINTVNISSNEHSDIMTLFRPLDETEVASMQKTVELIYDNFLNIVSTGRGMTTDDVDRIAQGRVWTGSDAIGINIANEIGGLTEALDYAAIAADLTDYRIVEYPEVKSSMDKMIESFSNTEAAINKVADPQKAVMEIYQQIKENNGVYARLPYTYNFNL